MSSFASDTVARLRILAHGCGLPLPLADLSAWTHHVGLNKKMVMKSDVVQL